MEEKKSTTGPIRGSSFFNVSHRRQPYTLTPERIARRQQILQSMMSPEVNNSLPSEQSVNQSMVSVHPVTQAILSGLRSPSSPAASVGDGNKSAGQDIHTSLRKACIDWKLVNKEAEVIRLRTEVTKLQSLLASMKEEKDKMEILKDKEIRELESKLSVANHEVAKKISEIDDLKVAVKTAEEKVKQVEKESRPDVDYLDNTIVQLKVNEAKLRGQLQDMSEDLRTAKIKHEQETITLKHEVKCLGLELKALKEEKAVLDRNRDELVQAVTSVPDLKHRNNQLIAENQQLKIDFDQLLENFERQKDELERLRSLPVPRDVMAPSSPLAEDEEATSGDYQEVEEFEPEMEELYDSHDSGSRSEPQSPPVISSEPQGHSEDDSSSDISIVYEVDD